MTETLAVCRLAADADAPTWASGEFVCVTRTPDELSIVCPEGNIPEDTPAERGWSALRVAGQLDFSLVGVLAGLTATLAEARISVFVISTYDTDYLLVKEADFSAAEQALVRAGHTVKHAS